VCDPTSTTLLAVPQMRSRHDVRVISGLLIDLPGTAAIEADVESRTVRIHGPVDAGEAARVLAAAGYEVAVAGADDA
jgi:copper chaperone CopZ